MHASFRILLLRLSLLAVAAAGCGCGNTFGRRDGPDFGVAFPDPRVLITTDDVHGVRAQLARARLPETREHHDRLIKLLAEQQTIRAGNLLLLVEAVTQPNDNYIYYSKNAVARIYSQRGQGEFAPVIDLLITAGIAKVEGVDRRWLGELIGRTQSDETIATLGDRFLPDLDDGSQGALHEILAGMPGSPALMPFLTGYLLPQGYLDGARGWAMVGELSFDKQRVELIEGLAKRNKSIDAQQMLATIETLSFDAARKAATSSLAAIAKPMSAVSARKIVNTFSFDNGKHAAVASLVDAGLQVDDSGMLKIISLFSFDSGRLRCLQTLAPYLADEPSATQARKLLHTFSFDANRLKAVATMASRWRSLSDQERLVLSQSLSFEPGRKKASQLLR